MLSNRYSTTVGCDMDESSYSSLILSGYQVGLSGNQSVPMIDHIGGLDSCDVPFCTGDNVNDCIDYINQVLFLMSNVITGHVDLKY